MNQTIDDASKNMEEIEDDVLQPEKVILILEIFIKF